MSLASIVILANGAIAQNEICSLTSFFLDLKTQASSGRFQIETFQLDLRDDDFAKEFVDKESGRKIYVGGQLVNGLSGKGPRRLRVKISFENQPNSTYTYDSLDGPEAETIYDKKWRLLSVSDEFRIADRVYGFTFGCERMLRR